MWVVLENIDYKKQGDSRRTKTSTEVVKTSEKEFLMQKATLSLPGDHLGLGMSSDMKKLLFFIHFHGGKL